MHVIVHGGAGGTPTEPDARRAVLDEAASTGRSAESPLGAVENAVRILESSPRFNAGVGSAVQSDGVARTDAGIMTSDLRAGAACSMPGVAHAVSVARVVLERTPHVLVSGEGALALADAYGIDTAVDLSTDRSRERWDARGPGSVDTRAQLEWVREQFGTAGSARNDRQPNASDHDTVGAVATDGSTVAAATSTGGRWFALTGRVGDVPQIGSGFYCTDAGGASATGAGEDIARVTLSREAVRHLERGEPAQVAAERSIETFVDRTGSRAGVIVMNRDGDVGQAYNTDAMQTSVATER